MKQTYLSNIQSIQSHAWLKSTGNNHSPIYLFPKEIYLDNDGFFILHIKIENSRYVLELFRAL